MLAGNLERLLAAFITEGPKNEEPRPATVKVIERIMITKLLFSVPTKLTVAMPTIKEIPESSEALTANS